MGENLKRTGLPANSLILHRVAREQLWYVRTTMETLNGRTGREDRRKTFAHGAVFGATRQIEKQEARSSGTGGQLESASIRRNFTLRDELIFPNVKRYTADARRTCAGSA
jgi:hypothetical protein